jgi:hypothetical protein
VYPHKALVELTSNCSNTAEEMHLLALANRYIEGPTIPVGHCSYCASLSRKIFVLLLPLVLLPFFWRLFFWQFKEKIKKELPADASSKNAGSSSVQAVCVCARCSMWSAGAQRSHKIDVR